MTDLIRAYPGVFVGLLMMVGALINMLMLIIGFFVTRALNELTAAVKELRAGLLDNTVLVNQHSIEIKALKEKL